MTTQTPDPKDIHDALRRLNVLISVAGRDVETYLEDPACYDTTEYFPSVLEALNDAQHLVVWIRSEVSK